MRIVISSIRRKLGGDPLEAGGKAPRSLSEDSFLETQNATQ